MLEFAERLGVEPNLVYRWRRELSKQEGLSFPGHGKQALTDARHKAYTPQKT